MAFLGVPELFIVSNAAATVGWRTRAMVSVFLPACRGFPVRILTVVR